MTLGDRLKAAGASPPKVWRPEPKVLLKPIAPPPLHGVVPRVLLGTEWWDIERRAAYQTTDYHCLACGIHCSQAKGKQWIEGHEVYRINYRKGRATYLRTVPLCHYCHNYVHQGRLRYLLAAKKVAQAKYRAIIQHGDKVLLDAHLKIRGENPGGFDLHSEAVAPWEKWRLVLNGTQFPPLYKTVNEWQYASKFGHIED